MQNENIDIPINIKETPEYILQKAEPYKPAADPNEAINDLLKNLESLIKAPQLDLHLFYQTAFPAVLKQHFGGDKTWPAPSELQEQFDVEYKPNAQTIYQQFALRHEWNKAKTFESKEYFDWIDLAWQTYSSIFQREWLRINFSPNMIWDYFESFLRIYTFHQSKLPSLKDKQGFEEFWFSPSDTKKILMKMVESIPNILPRSPSTKEVFGYYGLVALSSIQVYEQNYKQALETVKRLSLKQLIILSKACGSLMTLFLNVSMSHFMLEEYNKSSKLLETVAPFYLKNRKYFSKSPSYENLHRVYEKVVALLCINYIFLQQKPKAGIMENFKAVQIKIKDKDAKDKIADCFFKMKQGDLPTFVRLFTHITADFSTPEIIEKNSQKFRALSSVNFNTIIQNYRRIELSKMSKMLGLSKEQIIKRLKNLGSVESSESAWDITIMNPLLRQKKKINVQIDENLAIFDSQTSDQSESNRQWQRYRDEFAWLADKVRAL